YRGELAASRRSGCPAAILRGASGSGARAYNGPSAARRTGRACRPKHPEHRIPMSDKPGASRPAAQPTAKVDVPFGAHVELLRFFMGRRAELVERVQGLLNAQRQPPQHLQDRRLLARRFGDAFFTLPGVAPDRARLRGQLEEAHWASGFEPRETPGVHNDLVNPAEMMRRAFHLWAQTRWPGRNGRVRYAHTLFDVFAIRQLALLAMRVWDDGASGAGERLAEIQSLL